MSLPKKGLRKIKVGDCRYAWSATGNDGYINLSVVSLDEEGQLLSTAFDYQTAVTGCYYFFEGQSFDKWPFSITPGIVRQVIEHALLNGWNSQVKGPHFHLADKGKLLLRLPKQVP